MKHVYIVAHCLSFRNKDTEGKKSRARGRARKGGERGSSLMEMVKITQKKDDMKKENRGKNFMTTKAS